jgi:protease-4
MRHKIWLLTLIGIILLYIIPIPVTNLGYWFESQKGMRWNEEVLRGNGPEKIVYLRIQGDIKNEPNHDDDFNKEEFLSQMDQAIDDIDVKAIVINMNTSGGELSASEEIIRQIIKLKDAGKIVLASMGAITTSNSYLIAAPANYIFALNSTITGNLQFAPTNFTSTTREVSRDGAKLSSHFVNSHVSYRDFISVIEKGRKLNQKYILQLATGEYYSGKQALRIGLVDYIGTWRDGVHFLKKKLQLPDALIVTYTNKR